jgi:hypothetical protein
MSKVQNINVSDVHPFHADENICRPGGTFSDHKDRLSVAATMYPGWDSSQGIAVVYELTDEQKQKAIAEREQQWQELKDSTREFKLRPRGEEGEVLVSAADVRLAWEKVHLTSKGEIRTPKYGVVSSFRRNEVIKTDVNGARYHRGEPLIESIPAEIRSYDNVHDRIADTISENTLKDQGQKKLDNAGIVNAAVKMYREQSTQAEFRRVFKDGQGQKLWSFCVLNDRFPNLKVPTEENGVVEGLHNAVLVEPKMLSKLHKESLRKESKNPDLKQTDLESDFGRITNKGSNAPKIASKTEIEAMKQNPVQIVKFTVQAILDNDPRRVNRLNEAADEINNAVEEILKKHNIEL